MYIVYCKLYIHEYIYNIGDHVSECCLDKKSPFIEMN